MKNTNLLKSVSFLFFVICSTLQGWGATFTVNSSITSSDPLFSVAETMTNYTYSSIWTTSDKLISFTTGASITVTNVTGATITAITAEGVAANNANKTVSFTASDGTTTADGTSASWNNRKSTTMTTGQAFNSANVNNFKCGAGQTYTFTNKSSGSYAAGARIVITYTSTLPTSLTNGATTDNSQAVSWTAPSPAPANGYLVAYSTSSTAPGNSVTSTTGSYTVTAISAGTTSATLSALSPGTTYYWWVRSKNARGNSSWVAGSSFTTESGGGCSAYEFHYGTSGEDDWETACFEQVDETNEWQIEDFTIPSVPNFYVGYHGDGENGWNSTWSATKAWTDAFSDGNGAMVLLPTSSSKVGLATGATGTLTIWSNSGDKNKYVGFKPDGYAIMYGGNNYAFSTTATDHMLETDVVTLPNVGSTTYQMGIKTASSYMTCAHSSSAENINAMGTTTIDGGLRKIWLYSTADSWIGSSAKMAIWDATNSHWGDNTDAHKFMTKVNDNLWYGYVPTDAETIILVRVDPTKDDPAWDWGQSHDIIPGDLNNYVTITGSWSESKAEYTIGSTHPATGDKGKFRMWDNSSSSNWYVHWIPYYVLTYDANGGSGSTTQAERNSESSTTTVTVTSNGFTAPTGYEFAGWATSESRADAGTVDYAAGASYTLTANATLYAVWRLKTYTVNFAASPAGYGTVSPTSIASVSHGSTVSIASNVLTLKATDVTATATAAGSDYTYAFSSWSVSNGASITEAQTITANFTRTANKYSVTHTLSNVTTSSGSTGSNAATYGTNYTATFAASSGYVLPTTITVTIGGSAAPSGSYSYNYSTGVVTITGSYITGNIVITAAGEENVFRVTYSGNGNTGGTVPSDATAYDPDAEVTVAAGVPTKTNYTFVGWLNSVDNTIYRAGQAFTITAHTTLTAQWGGVNDSWGLWWFYNEDNRTTSGFGTNNITMGINQGTSNSFSAVTYQGLTASYRSGGQTPTASVIIPARSTATLYYIGRGSSSRTVQLKQSSTVKYSFEPAASDGATGSISNIAAGTYTLTSSGNINWSVVAFKFHTPTGYDVKFQNGSVSPASVSGMPTNYSGVPSGKKIAAPVTDPTAANYIFGGWYTTSACSSAFDFANTTITADTIIYAKWTAKTAPTTSYTFTLSDPCADASPSATLSGSQSGWSYQLYKDGVASDDPKAGTGSALTWTSLGVGTYLVKTVETSTQASAQIGSSATVYASTSITSNLASSRSVNANVSTTVSITATGASPTYQWYTCNSDGTGKVAIDGKTTNTLSYAFTNADAPTKYICCVLTSTCGTITSNIQTVTITPTYLLTYDANGGSGAPAAAYRPATTAALSSTQPTRSNYAFEGWNTKSNGSGTRYAAGASFPMPAQATTLYAEWVETATLTWTLNVNTAESSIGTASKASTNARISNTTGMTNLANYGSLAITSSAKSGLTSKIGTPASYDANKYMYVTFTVPAGYEFVPTSISVQAQPVSTNKDVKLILTDGANTITKTQTNLSQGSTATVTETNSAKTAFKGTVTLKIYCYGATDAYRLGTPITVSGKVRPVTLTYVGGSGSNWNTTANWSPACIPTIDHDVVIEVPVDVNITNARAKSVVIYNNGSTKTGQLILDAGKELVVSRTVRKTTDGSSYTATGENDIVFNSTSALGLGALVMGSHDGTNKATVNFTTRAAGTKDDNTSIAQYVGTPFNDENNILYNWYNSWIYGIAYEGGSIDWVRINEGEGMIPFRGYCVFSADGANHVYWEQGTLNATTDRTISGLNWQSGAGTANLNNENLLANSWMAPIYIKAMESSDFVNADATIYIFNSTSASEYESGGFAGNYDSYTVNTANAVIPAMQSFSVFTKGTGASVTLDYSRIVYEPAVAGTATPEPNKVISRERQGDTEANKLRIFVRTESGLGDMLYMWEREDFSEAFENGWDGRKMYGESYAPQLYAITPDGAMAVNCVPTYEGVLIGFRAGTDEQTYTFNFEYDADAEPLYLYDKYADAYTRVLSGNTYQFVANDYEAHARFSLTHYMPGVATGIEASATGDQNTEIRCQKILLNERILILRDGKLYDVTGKTVK